MQKLNDKTTGEKRRGRLKKAAIGLLSIFLALTVIVQIGVWLAVGWLNGLAGQKWLKAEMKTLLGESGYTVTFESLHYRLISSVSLEKIEVGDKAGPLLNLEGVTLNIGLAAIATGTASLSLDIAKAHLLRWPEGSGKNPDEDPAGKAILKPFALPDLPIKTVNIRRIRIEDIALPARSDGRKSLDEAEINSLILKGWVKQENTTVKAQFRLQSRKDGQGEKSLSARLSLDPSRPAIHIENLSVDGGSITAQAGKGEVDFAREGKVDLLLPFESKKLENLWLGRKGKLSGTLNLTGKTENPSLTLNVELEEESFRLAGLEKISVSLQADNMAKKAVGKASIKTRYKDFPIFLETGIGWEEKELHLREIVLDAPEIKATGSLRWPSEERFVLGDLSLEIKSLSSYGHLDERLAKAKIKGAAAHLTLRGSTGRQDATLKADIKELSYETLSAAALNVEVNWQDLFSGDPYPRETSIQANDLIAGGEHIDRVEGHLNMSENPDQGTLTIAAARNGIAPVSLSAKAQVKGIRSKNTPEASEIKASIASVNGRIGLTGHMNATDLSLKLTAKDFPVGALVASAPHHLASLAVNGTGEIKGAHNNPAATADITLSPWKIPGAQSAPDIRISGRLQYGDGKLETSAEGQGKGMQTLSASASFPVVVSLNPLKMEIRKDAPLRGSFEADLKGSDLALLLLPPTQSFKGRFFANGAIGGTLAEPEVNGSITLDDARFEDTVTGLTVNDIDARAVLTRKQFTLESFKGGNQKDGTLEAQGKYVFGDNESVADFKVKLKNMYLLRGKTANGRLSGDLSLTGKGRDYLLGGTVSPEYIDINIPDHVGVTIPKINVRESGASQGAESQHESPLNLALDILFSAKNRIFVRGRGLDAEFGGKVKVAGTIDKPLFTGSMKSLRGLYSDFGKRFTLTRADLIFSGTIPPGPELDIIAQTDAQDVKALIGIKGPVASPSISISSEPPLPEDEVLSRMLFGKDMSQISPYQAVQLAQTLQRLAGKSGPALFDPMGIVLEATGLDDISVDVNDDGAATVGAGKYLNEKVYMEVKGGNAKESGKARIEIEVTPDISVESEVGQDAQGGGGIFWKRDY